MKIMNWMLGLALVGLVSVSTSCSKGSAPPPEYMEVNGVKVELPKLEQAFSNANDELKATLSQISSAMRYQQFDQALMGLDSLANNPGVTEEQKKVVNTLIEQMKQVITKSAGAAPATQ